MSAFDKLFEEAKAAQKTAYAPYSNFQVGAALLTSDGKVVSGCNVENGAYHEGTCAEGGAIAAMIRGGSTKIDEVVVVANAALCTPCGGCRQKLSEFASNKQIKIHVANLEGLRRTFTMEELLPAGFLLNEQIED